MALHQFIERLLLTGARVQSVQPPPVAQAPAALKPLIDALAGPYSRFDERAVYYGHRYRSGFWAIYLLSAIAVACAIMPLALGWDSVTHALHPYAGLWAAVEVAVIGSVSAIYWQGHRRDWQSQWLHARTTAELTWYLPMVAPLIDFAAPTEEANWYLRVFDPGQHPRASSDIATLCAQSEALALELLAAVWSNPVFIASYAGWTISILEQQRQYHRGVTLKHHTLLHRIHRITHALFALTALGAILHLVIHTLWLSLVTTFFPALGASLHGGLAQSESYRLSATSDRLVAELEVAINNMRATMDAYGSVIDIVALKASIEAAIALILEEHQDWHLLIRPHHLPLA
jgi:hypothetical protein